MTVADKFEISTEVKARLKAKASITGRRILSELALEFMDDDFIKGIAKFLSSYKPDDMAALITEDKFIDLGHHLAGAKSYKAFIDAVPLRRSCEIMYNLISKARPDLAAVIAGAGDKGALWLIGNVKYMREKILSGEPKEELPKVEEEPKPQLTMATCTACKREWVIDKKDVENLKLCPFCGESLKGKEESKHKE